MVGIEEFSRAIMRCLVADFASRHLSSKELRNGYEGPTLAELKQACSADSRTDAVDFDLAFNDLESRKFVATGPMVPDDNRGNSMLFVIGGFSKREYAYLTEKGYKAGQQMKSKKTEHSSPRVHISGGTFHQSSIGIGSHITQSIAASNETKVLMELSNAVNESDIDTADRTALLEAIGAMQQAHNTPGFVDRYKEFIGLAADHMTIIAPFLPALSALLGN